MEAEVQDAPQDKDDIDIKDINKEFIQFNRAIAFPIDYKQHCSVNNELS